jgi:hypothetical protein
MSGSTTTTTTTTSSTTQVNYQTQLMDTPSIIQPDDDIMEQDNQQQQQSLVVEKKMIPNHFQNDDDPIESDDNNEEEDDDNNAWIDVNQDPAILHVRMNSSPFQERNPTPQELRFLAKYGVPIKNPARITRRVCQNDENFGKAYYLWDEEWLMWEHDPTPFDRNKYPRSPDAEDIAMMKIWKVPINDPNLLEYRYTRKRERGYWLYKGIWLFWHDSPTLFNEKIHFKREQLQKKKLFEKMQLELLKEEMELGSNPNKRRRLDTEVNTHQVYPKAQTPNRRLGVWTEEEGEEAIQTNLPLRKSFFGYTQQSSNEPKIVSKGGNTINNPPKQSFNTHKGIARDPAPNQIIPPAATTAKKDANIANLEKMMAILTQNVTTMNEKVDQLATITDKAIKQATEKNLSLKRKLDCLEDLVLETPKTTTTHVPNGITEQAESQSNPSQQTSDKQNNGEKKNATTTTSLQKPKKRSTTTTQVSHPTVAFIKRTTETAKKDSEK